MGTGRREAGIRRRATVGGGKTERGIPTDIRNILTE